MPNTFREVYKKTGTDSYQLVGNVGVNGIKLDIMRGASSSEDGEIGLIPKPSAGQQDYILTGAGIFNSLKNIIMNEKLIKNDLLTEESGYLLDASQGKILNDKLSIKSQTIKATPYLSLSSTNKITLYMYKIYRICFMEIEWVGSVGSNYSILTDFTIPNEFIPVRTIFVTCANNSSGNADNGVTRYEIRSNGQFGFSTNKMDNVERYCCVSYITKS